MALPSICIPSIGTRITKDKIRRVFQNMNIGELEKIAIKHNGKFCSAFIYIKNWNLKSKKAIEFHKKLVEGEEINLIYNFPWFWKCRANHNLRELKYNKLGNEITKYQTRINTLKTQNLNLKSYARWLTKI